MRRLLVLLAGLAALGATPAQAATPTPSALLTRFAPVLTLAPAEPFAPIRVSGFLRSAVQEQLPDGSYRLNVEPCAAEDGPAAVPCYAATRTLPVTYARYQAVGDRIVLQYWFLYEDDLLLLPVAGDALWQGHEGDWEAVAVVLDASGQPLEAAYSAHCAGHVR